MRVRILKNIVKNPLLEMVQVKLIAQCFAEVDVIFLGCPLQELISLQVLLDQFLLLAVPLVPLREEIDSGSFPGFHELVKLLAFK